MSDLKPSGFATVGTLEDNRNIKALQNKGNEVTMGLGIPRQAEGKVGDITVRQIASIGLICYIKTNSGWYDINSLGKVGRIKWIPMALQNSWVHHSSSYNQPSYFKDDLGFVHLRGGLKDGASASVAITTLPSGFRPTATIILAAARATAQESVKITSGGIVNISNGGDTSLSFLDGVSFYARQEIKGYGGGSASGTSGDGSAGGNVTH